MSVLSDRMRHKLESNLNMLMDEYKFAAGQCENYVTRIYSCINFTFVFYGVVLTVFQNILGRNNDSLTALLIFFYLLPVLTYILGLFYAYNAVEICKHSFFLMRIESDIIDLNRRLGFPRHFHGRTAFSKKTPGGFMLPCGTMLVFYLVMSPSVMAYATFLIDFKQLPDTICMKLIVRFVPWAFFLIYMAFMSYLIRQMVRFRELYHTAMKKERLPYEEDLHL